MVNKIILDNRTIETDKYEQKTTENGLLQVTVDFKVSHEDYHEITTLLYKGVFDVEVPERGLAFKGKIANYSTSVTNLYEKGNLGNFHLSLIEAQ
ncbi:YkvR family protein [Evansella sp. LMS18]|uniref:DUF3219 family protein n=1 Tax=Evansella sp. LMS18 TaxID=2924033 RepID=UPI0020D1A2AF|nr:DUF3219 family protein [Evansella sp. LMS18]UTR13042.1 YkvR family protein [Evansella sp. LMS18]